jgi:hypothetical protein
MAKLESTVTWTVYDADKMTQREIYGIVLTDLGKQYPEIVGLSADLAKSTKIGTFGDAYPDRFFNLGIAEQNLFGVSAGLAKAGLIHLSSPPSPCFASGRAVRICAHGYLLSKVERENSSPPTEVSPLVPAAPPITGRRTTPPYVHSRISPLSCLRTPSKQQRLSKRAWTLMGLFIFALAAVLSRI